MQNNQESDNKVGISGDITHNQDSDTCHQRSEVDIKQDNSDNIDLLSNILESLTQVEERQREDEQKIKDSSIRALKNLNRDVGDILASLDFIIGKTIYQDESAIQSLSQEQKDSFINYYQLLKFKMTEGGLLKKSDNSSNRDLALILKKLDFINKRVISNSSTDINSIRESIYQANQDLKISFSSELSQQLYGMIEIFTFKIEQAVQDLRHDIAKKDDERRQLEEQIREIMFDAGKRDLEIELLRSSLDAQNKSNQTSMLQVKVENPKGQVQISNEEDSKNTGETIELDISKLSVGQVEQPQTQVQSQAIHARQIPDQNVQSEGEIGQRGPSQTQEQKQKELTNSEQIQQVESELDFDTTAVSVYQINTECQQILKLKSEKPYSFFNLRHRSDDEIGVICKKFQNNDCNEELLILGMSWNSVAILIKQTNFQAFWSQVQQGMVSLQNVVVMLDNKFSYQGPLDLWIQNESNSIGIRKAADRILSFSGPFEFYTLDSKRQVSKQSMNKKCIVF